MTDIYKAKNKWVSNGSSVSTGARQGFELDLSETEKELLSSFILVVDENGNIKITSNTRVVAYFAFTEKSRFSITKITQEENGVSRIFAYKNVENFIENKLHIAMTDQFDMRPYLPFEATAIENIHVISLNYDPKNLKFEVNVLDKICCGNASLYFEKN